MCRQLWRAVATSYATSYYLISYRIRYSPSAATLTDMAVQLGRKEEDDEEEEEVRVYGGLLGRQEKGSRKM